MGILRPALTMIAAACVATQLHADGLTYYTGVEVTSNYVSNGITQTNGKSTVQAYFEVETNGLYAGTWMSGVDFGNGDNIEVDLYAGYRTAFDNKLFLDVGYAHYFYDDSGSCCGEFKLTLAYPVLEKLAVEGYLAYNPQSGTFVKSAALAYAVNDQFALSGRYGHSESNHNQFWSVGASMALSEFISGDIRYYGAQSGDEGLVISLSLATDQSTVARLLVNPFRR